MLKKKQGNILLASKQLLMLICLICFTILAHAQRQELQKRPVPLNPLKDKLEYLNFTIRLIPTTDGYYGFDILQAGKLMLHQIDNPIPARGITVKQDAFELAKWMIVQYKRTGNFPRVFPPDFEKQIQLAQPQ